MKRTLAATLLMITLGGVVGAAPVVVEHPAHLPSPTDRPVRVRNLDRSDDCPGTSDDRPRE